MNTDFTHFDKSISGLVNHVSLRAKDPATWTGTREFDKGEVVGEPSKYEDSHR